MKPLKIYLHSLLPIISLFSSCSLINQSSGYDASPVFASHHEKAGEVKASAGYGGMLGVQSHVSYALTNRLVIMTGGVYNHQTVRALGILDPIYFKLRSHYYEGALGFYLPIKEALFTNFEVMAGLGKGVVDKKNSFYKSFSNSYNDSYSQARGNYTKSFFQLSAKLPTTNVSSEIDFVLANRISYLRFSKLSFYEMYTYQNDTINFDKSSVTLLEPVLILNCGKKLKFTGQIGLAIPISKKLKRNIETYANASGIFQLGLTYDIK